MKKLNEACFNETYAENRLKCFRIQKMRIKNTEKRKFNLTLIEKNAEKFEKKAEVIEENFEENFEMLKKKSD